MENYEEAICVGIVIEKTEMGKTDVCQTCVGVFRKVWDSWMIFMNVFACIKRDRCGGQSQRVWGKYEQVDTYHLTSLHN